MWIDRLYEVLLAFATFSALRAFYVAFDATWPEKYWDENKGIDPIISRGLMRYLAFRFAPVLIGLMVAGTAAHRIGQNRQTVVALAVALYAAQGVVEMTRALFARPMRRRMAALRGAVLLGQFLAVATAFWLGGRADSYVPTLHETVVAATTALFIFVMSAPAVLILSRPEYKDSYDIFNRSREEIDPELIARLDQADPSGAFTAIAIVENLNRPPWFRRLERIFMRGRATYGLMQIKSARPLSDSESVDAFIAKNRGILPLKGGSARRKLFKRHNKSKRFAEFASDAFRAERSRKLLDEWD